MSHQHSSFDWTSDNFEKAALNRFRSLARFLPPNCQVYRERWDCSTVVCLDFIRCRELLEIAQTNADLFLNSAQELALGKTIIFKIGNKVVGWNRFAASS